MINTPGSTIKLFIAIDSLVKGGTERRMLELVKALSTNKNFDIYLISLDDKVDYKYVYDLPIKFEIISRRSGKDFSVYSKIYKKVKSFKPNIIHTWGSMSSVVLLPIAKLTRAKFVNGYIGQAPTEVSLKDKFYFRGLLTFPFSDAVVSNSYAGLKSYRVPAKKSHVIYNGLDFKRFENLQPAAEVKSKLLGNEQGQSFIVAMVAAFEDRKDYTTLANAAIQMCEQNTLLKFLLIGGGDNFEAIKAKIPPQLLNSQILLLGKRSDIESILQIINVGVLLTNSKVHGEGVSNSIIEYMASGKPVIATRGGGTDEIVIDGENGFLIDYAATEQLIEKINMLISDTAKADNMGKAGRKFVQEKFDSVKVSQSYVDLYSKLLSIDR